MLLKPRGAPEDLPTRVLEPSVRLAVPAVQPRASRGVDALRQRRAARHAPLGRCARRLRRTRRARRRSDSRECRRASCRRRTSSTSSRSRSCLTPRRSIAPRPSFAEWARSRSQQPGVEHAVQFPGLSVNGFANKPNAAVDLHRPQAVRGAHDARRRAAARSSARSIRSSSAIQDAFVGVFPPPAVNGLGAIGGFKLMLRGSRRTRRLGALRVGASRCSASAYQTPQLAGAVLELPGERAAALRRRRSRQGEAARHAAQRSVPDAAHLSRLGVRERLQQVRPHVSGDRAGRRAVPRDRRRTSRSSRCATRSGEMVPLAPC